MVKTGELIELLEKKNIKSFLMVPCSIFKPIAAWMLSNNYPLIFPPNEAHALGFASGIYLATGKPAAIFIQNSGLNNIANAQTSLNYLYKIPAVVFISWRGAPGKKDAPEHALMGKITRKILNGLKIPHVVLSKNWRFQVEQMVGEAVSKKRVVALLVPDGFLENEPAVSRKSVISTSGLTRYETLSLFKREFKDSAAYISMCGYTSRDSFAVSPTDDFYMLGSMGHTFSVGAGVASSLATDKSKKRIVVFDGDGSCLMHLGSLVLVGIEPVRDSNLIYVVLDNSAYESTGGQPTLSSRVDFIKVAEGLGFPQIFFVTDNESLTKTLRGIRPGKAAFVWVKVNSNQLGSGPRVSDKYTCPQITKNFIRSLSKSK